MTNKKWSISFNEKGVVELPQDLLDHTGWKPDTLLKWDVSEDGVISLKKAEPTQCKSEPDEES
ncbi:MAG TPA: hypothetical protein DCQ67_06930 [Acidimicrobiaceae bacterium]|nr:hypothetical protein [Acidimicrobiaceae bacterium]